MDVGVRELKAKLSEYVARAGGGASVVVTDRGKPVAVLVPWRNDNWMDAAVEAGWLELPRRTALSEPRLRRSERSTADVLDDDRG